MTKFKIGDRVKVIEKEDRAEIGDTGTVRGDISGRSLYKHFDCCVEIDQFKGTDNGWDCDGLIPSGDGLCFEDSQLELLPTVSNLEKVMNMLSIPKDTPINIFFDNGHKYAYSPCAFTGDKFIDKDGDNAVSLIGGLITGKYTFKVTLPFPQEGDKFYYIDHDGNIGYFTYDGNDLCDIALRLAGNFFETKEDAAAHKEEIMKKYKEVM